MPYERFMDKVHEDFDSDCWLWMGAVKETGYGQFDVGGKTRLAHRVSYAIHYGEDPGELHVCHSCDTPSCVNPEHLWLGTQSENIKDAFEKGRKTNKGGSHPQSKLTEAEVLEIFHATGKQTDIAEQYGIDESHVRCIKRGKTWSHITKDLLQ